MEVKDYGWTKTKCRSCNKRKTEKEEGQKEVKSKGWKKEDQQIEKMSFEENFDNTLFGNKEKLEDKSEKTEVVEE